MTERIVPHGTLAGYQTHNCRCGQCRRARRDYDRRQYGSGGPVPSLRGAPEDLRAASLTVCDRAADVSEARDLLVMLGLVALPEPVVEPAPSRCGTAAGALAHRRAGEKPCEPCRVACNAAKREQAARRRERAGAA